MRSRDADARRTIEGRSTHALLFARIAPVNLQAGAGRIAVGMGGDGYRANEQVFDDQSMRRLSLKPARPERSTRVGSDAEEKDRRSAQNHPAPAELR